jgi:hypothetical protein
LPRACPPSYWTQRPDVAQAEGKLNAANADIHVRVARRVFPDHSVYRTDRFRKRGPLVASLPAGVYLLAAGINQPVFEGSADFSPEL